METATRWARRQPVGNPATKAVLLALAAQCGRQGVAMISLRRIAMLAALSPRSVGRHLDALEDAGLIGVTRRSVGGTRLPNEYKLAMEPKKKRRGWWMWLTTGR